MRNDLSFVDADVAAAQWKAEFDRRRFLRGLGACIALPAFTSMMPKGSAFAAPIGPGGPLATTAAGAPLRMAWIYFPNGAIPAAWWPTGWAVSASRATAIPTGVWKASDHFLSMLSSNLGILP